MAIAKPIQYIIKAGSGGRLRLPSIVISQMNLLRSANVSVTVVNTEHIPTVKLVASDVPETENSQIIQMGTGERILLPPDVREFLNLMIGSNMVVTIYFDEKVPYLMVKPLDHFVS